MSDIFNKRGVLFFAVYVLIAIAVTAFLSGRSDGALNLTNPLWILGSALIATFVFQMIMARISK